MKRFFAWLRAIFGRAMDKLEDPEVMLDQARRDMQQALVANKEKAIVAITQKNRLQGMLEEQQKKAESLEQNATSALKQGDRDLARQFLREKASADATIEQLKVTHAQAVESVDQVKLALKRQEEDVRRKLAEALAMKAQWKTAQIQTSISKALEGLTFESQYEGSFASVKDKIKDKQAEAAARQEMFGGSLGGKMLAMEESAADHSADEELRKLEEKLGLTKPEEALPEQTTTGDVESELDALQQRINQSPES